MKNRACAGTQDAADSKIARGDSGIHNTPASGNPDAAINFIRCWFAASEQPAYVCTLPNDKDDASEPGERHVTTRDGCDVVGFIKKWDRAKRGLFVGTSTVRAGMPRNKDNVAEICGLWADIDFKDVIDDADSILRRVKALRLPPSIINVSGNGFHCYWRFKEALAVNIIDGAETVYRVEAALKLLADLVGADVKVAQVAALMRLPGTHNSKRGEWKLVETVENNDLNYELDDLEDMLAETSPIVLRKERERPKTLGETGFFAEYAKRFGSKPPVDVEQRLAEMLYMGGGDAAIHCTQLSVTSSMLNKGVDIEEVIRIVLAATRVAAGDYGARWNWRIEEREIRKMCASWLKKLGKEKAAAASAPAKEGDVDADTSVDIHTGKAAQALVCSPYVWRDPATMPRREWLYARRLIRKYTTATVGAGGTCKSSLEIAEFIAMAAGRPLFGERVGVPLRVWYYNLEDPLEEVERRVQATCLHFGIKYADVGQSIFLNSGRDQPLVIAETTKSGTAICHPIVDVLVELIVVNKIDVLIIDPFVSCHHVVENDNNAIDMVTKEWGRVADRGNCGVELVHHVRKGEGEVTFESARGGGSFGDACRAVRVVNRMTKEEAVKAGSTTTGNISAPTSTRATWHHLPRRRTGFGWPAFTWATRPLARRTTALVWPSAGNGRITQQGQPWRPSSPWPS